MTKDFRFGIGISSYQTEGAINKREPCIWDDFSHTPNKILDSSNGDRAIDFYHRYKEDICLAQELGIQDFRFSLSWPRIVFQNGEENEEGIRFYQDVIKTIKECGMNPVITLYHWDLPSYLQKEGGFTNREILTPFRHYVEIVAKHFGKDVNTWLTFNEPQCFIGLGYTGLHHAPGIRYDYHQILTASHHVLLCHSLAYKLLKEANPNCQISFVNTFNTPIPAEEDSLHEELLQKELFALPKDNTNFYTLSLFMDPLFLGKYPDELYQKENCDFILEGDMKAIQEAKCDFMALNIYTGTYYRLDENKNLQVSSSPYPKEEEDSDLNWLKKRPKSLAYGIKYLYKRYPFPILISENGACYKDKLTSTGVHDRKRCQFLEEYLAEIDTLLQKGYPLLGYYYWSLLDNFEWAEGYLKRFGLVYVDYDKDLRRIKKDSFQTYQKIIQKVSDR